jgi:hypothetical protein
MGAIAQFGGFLRYSVCGVIAGVIAMPWHPLKAQRNPCGMDLNGGLVDRVAELIGIFHVLDCL